jgi:hypothetical protein
MIIIRHVYIIRAITAAGRIDQEDIRALLELSEKKNNLPGCILRCGSKIDLGQMRVTSATTRCGQRKEKRRINQTPA